MSKPYNTGTIQLLTSRHFNSLVNSNVRYLYIFQLLIAVFVMFTCASNASAKKYGTYNLKRLLTVSDIPSGRKYSFDHTYLDQMLNDLLAHAKNYPSQFDTLQDKQRATQDVKALSGMLDILINVPAPNSELLIRAGQINSIGHNLDIPGAAAKANSIFLRLLAMAPSDPQGNYMYGMFLASVGKPKEALPYLEKALAVGVLDATYAIGMTYLALGDKEQALKNLENYKQHKPSDGNVDKLIDAIRKGKIKINAGSL